MTSALTNFLGPATKMVLLGPTHTTPAHCNFIAFSDRHPASAHSPSHRQVLAPLSLVLLLSPRMATQGRHPA